MTNKLATALALLSLAHTGSSFAQPGSRAGGEDGARNPIERFESVAPKLGALMPDLTLHDRSGKELRLRELLTGHHTVLVLGCLT